MDKDKTTENGGDPKAGELICKNSSNLRADDSGNPWSTGLFDCHEHKMNACPLGSYIYLLMMSALCTQWLMGSKYRSKLRRRYNLVEAPYGDVISHIFCPYCALCQEFRELKNKGLDPSLGWNGVLAEQRGTEYPDHQMKVPPPYQAMKK
ncbi:protein PLANT CADMIUM RESISTANCE 8-like isoform X3 [Rhodamnia argentea]|uniref:Protein PLANT CADMIUM RESISTANCE 8-like isoform X3 n=1 Tax=Rhodamnia argentea TaxID=178133 RepID=A0ABM3HVP8_9MYRT|nr:protein PLANT CADMIUM RESISTANCE 8-like isoform X3 [Rhodamnia argentea]